MSSVFAKTFVPFLNNQNNMGSHFNYSIQCIVVAVYEIKKKLESTLGSLSKITG